MPLSEYTIKDAYNDTENGIDEKVKGKNYPKEIVVDIDKDTASLPIIMYVPAVSFAGNKTYTLKLDWEKFEVEKIITTKLADLIQEAKGKEQGNKTQSAFYELNEAIQTAENELQNSNITEEQLKKAIDDLEKAVKKFEESEENTSNPPSSGGTEGSQENPPATGGTQGSAVNPPAVSGGSSGGGGGSSSSSERDRSLDRERPSTRNTNSTSNTTSNVAPNSTPNATVTIEEEEVAKSGPDINFIDVKDNHWAIDYIRTVVQKGIMLGVDDNRFDPKGKLSRAMLVSMLARISNEKVDEIAPIEGITQDQWYSKDMNWAVNAQIVQKK